jgi:3',5'-cyclic-AMP phosphodiesterase
VTTTVLQLSDTHFAAHPTASVHGVNPDERLAAVLSVWRQRGEVPQLVLLTGDNADDGSPAAYARLHEAVSALGAPVLALSGNHDDPAALAAVFGSDTMVEFGGWRVIGFDTSRPNQIHGTLDVPSSLEEIDALDERPTVVAVHHPPRSRSTNAWFQLEGAAEFVAGVARRPHVRAVVSGHLHETFEAEEPPGVALLGCPSTLIGIAHDGDDYEVRPDLLRGARLLRLEEDGTFTSSLVAG